MKQIPVAFICDVPGCRYFYRGLGGEALRAKGIRQHMMRVHRRIWKMR